MPQSIQIARFGGPEVLKLVETSSKSLKPNGVRVQVTAAGVNFADLMMRMGMYPEAPPRPFTPGYEIAGQVIEVGSEVTRFKKGDRVFAATKFGGYTTEVVLPEDQIWKTPGNLTDAQAASVPVNFLTAWLALQEMGRVRAGDRVLIPSAAGGVGVAAVQIAARAGATVTGLVGSPEKIELVRSLGAHRVILNSEWERENTHPKPSSNANNTDKRDSGAGNDDQYEIILEATGGKALKRAFARLAPAGRVVHFGVSGMIHGKKRSVASAIKQFAQTPFFHPLQLMTANKGVFGINVLQLFTPEKRQILVQAMEKIIQHLEAGDYKTVVAREFPLADAAAAHSFLQSRKAIGKVVLTNAYSNP